MMKKMILTLLVLIPHFLFGMRAHKYRGNMPLIHSAIRKGAYELVSKILKKNPHYINRIDRNSGLTPLMEAIRSGDDPIVALLLHRGAKLEIEDFDGRTALSYAAENYHYNNYEAIVAFLLLYGARADHTDRSNHVPQDYDYNGNELLYGDYKTYLEKNPDANNNVFDLNTDFFK